MALTPPTQICRAFLSQDKMGIFPGIKTIWDMVLTLLVQIAATNTVQLYIVRVFDANGWAYSSTPD